MNQAPIVAKTGTVGDRGLSAPGENGLLDPFD